MQALQPAPQHLHPGGAVPLPAQVTPQPPHHRHRLRHRPHPASPPPPGLPLPVPRSTSNSSTAELGRRVRPRLDPRPVRQPQHPRRHLAVHRHRVRQPVRRLQLQPLDPAAAA